MYHPGQLPLLRAGHFEWPAPHLSAMAFADARPVPMGGTPLPLWMVQRGVTYLWHFTAAASQYVNCFPLL